MKRFDSVICCLLLVLLFGPGNLTAQFSAPKHSNEFLAIGVGARALGMGSTQVAIANDVTSGYWNPAGLMDNPYRYDGMLMHAEYFAGIAKFDYAAIALPVDSLSQMAISIIRFGVDDIPDTRFLYDANGAINYDNILFFSAADYAFIFSYARKVAWIEGLQVGANVKVVHRIAGSFANAWGFGIDAGARLVRNNWQFGMMLRDITGTFNAWSHNSELVADVYSQTGNEIPTNSIEVTLPRAIFGAGRYFPIGDKFGALAALDLNFTFDGQRNVLLGSKLISVDPSLGLEVDFKKVAFLRFGAGNVQRVKDFDGSFSNVFQPDFGLGFKINNVAIDYALTNFGAVSDVLYSHVFSLKVGID